jgi:acetyltransferase-like isoleucine patch superfamily enzyme
MNCVSLDFKHGENFEIGELCVIDEDVIVGDNVKIGHHCTLRSGTRFGNNIDFADYCKTTGICYVGNDVNIRTGSCISKSVIVEDKTFIGAGVMSSHTKHIYHHRPDMPKRQFITRIGYGSIIGSSVNLSAGISVVDNAIIGYGSLVTKDVTEAAIYVGSPVRKLAELPPEYIIKKPDDYVEHMFSPELLAKYLPYYKEG